MLLNVSLAIKEMLRVLWVHCSYPGYQSNGTTPSSRRHCHCRRDYRLDQPHAVFYVHNFISGHICLTTRLSRHAWQCFLSRLVIAQINLLGSTTNLIPPTRNTHPTTYPFKRTLSYMCFFFPRGFLAGQFLYTCIPVCVYMLFL